MRQALFVGSLLVGTILVACDPGVGLKVENRSASALCKYESERSVGDSGRCYKIEPGDSPTFSIICTREMEKTVVLTVGQGGPRFYARTATCGKWKDSGATVTVRQRDGEFIVEDGFD